MISLFDLGDSGKVTIRPEVLLVNEFKVVWNKHKEKEEALKALTYIYFIADYNSPYANYPNDRKREQVKLDLYDAKWKEPIEYTIAIDKYISLTTTPALRLLGGARHACDKLTEYFYSVDFTEKDEEGKLIHTAKDVSANLEKIGKIIESLDMVEDKVKKERTGKSSIRGGGEVGQYED